jgi:hypothetical protein
MCAALGRALGVSRGYGGTLLRSLLIAQSRFDIRILLSIRVIVVTPILLLKGGVKWANKAHHAFSVTCKAYCGHLNFWSTLLYWTLFKFQTLVLLASVQKEASFNCIPTSWCAQSTSLVMEQDFIIAYVFFLLWKAQSRNQEVYYWKSQQASID